MKRYLGSLTAAVVLAGCGEVTDSLLPEDSGDSGLVPSGVASDYLYDGTLGDAAPNSHFYFLSPLVESPTYDGVADDFRDPTVLVCKDPSLSSEGAPEVCGDTLAVFTMEPNDEGDQISVNPGVGYSVVLKTATYPVVEGDYYRISVSILDKMLGWVDVRAYDQQTYNSFQHTDPNGYVAISDQGSANIAFRIEDGALEQEYCDRDQIEDCDVEIFSINDEGCLRVYNLPGAIQETLGTQACVPASSAQHPNIPDLEEFVAVMTLEEGGQPQGGLDPSWQIPFFPDIKTIPDGIVFDGGVSVTICQEPDAVNGFHGFLRPFIILSNGDVILPKDYVSEEALALADPNYIPRCDAGSGVSGAADHHLASAGSQNAQPALLGRFVQGLSSASQFLMPKPLHARRRLHGGLNTVVWKLSDGDDGDGGEPPRTVSGVSGLELTGPETSVLEMGALLDISLFHSYAVVPSDQLLGSEVVVEIHALDPTSAHFPFEVPVIVTAVNQETGDTIFSDSAVYADPQTPLDADSSYTARYTPTEVGTFEVTITIDGRELPGEFVNEVTPLSGDLVVVVDIEGGAPAAGLPVYLYDEAGDILLDAQGDTLVATTAAVTGHPAGYGEATFADIVFGDYTVHLPKRDFDMQFGTEGQTITEAMTHEDFAHAQDGNKVTFSATTFPDMPATSRIWRVGSVNENGAGGSGHAFQYVPSGRSWTSAQNQVRDEVLDGVPGHLTSVATADENLFVQNLFSTVCEDGLDSKKCKVRGWLGLTDEEVEGTFVWVDGESSTFRNWRDGIDPADDRKADSKDHTEIAPDGFWNVINGASSTNDGYFIEWDAEQPEPPFRR